MKTRFLIFVALMLMTSSLFAMTLASKDVGSGQRIGDEFIYNGMGCNGQNASPELHWSGAPKETKSYAVTVYDPDAPTGSGFWHWVVYNIPPTTQSLERAWKSDGKNGSEVTNDFGSTQYGGPCPPPGKPHTYIFTVHALKTDKIDLPAGATNAFARFMIEAATLDKAKFKGTYGRKAK